MKINPNLDSKAGKSRGVTFRTGAHKDKRKEAVKTACRKWKTRREDQ